MNLGIQHTIDLPIILIPLIELEFSHLFDYFRLKCCMNWKNKKNNLTEEVYTSLFLRKYAKGKHFVFNLNTYRAAPMVIKFLMIYV